MDAIVVDGHADTIGRALDDGEDLGTETGKGHLDLPRMFRGGLDAQFMSCFVEPKYIPRKEAAKRAFRMIDAVKQWAAKYPERLAIARTAADVRRAAAAKKVCGILCIEGGHAIEDDLGLLRSFFELGVRYMTLTWNNSLLWAEAARDPGKVKGLTDFGREVVREMNRLGMLVDLSHVAVGTMRDALETTSAPVIFSHSSARALCDHARNVPDEVLTALATNGGVCMVTFVPAFVSDDCRAWEQDVVDDMRARGEDPVDWTAYTAALQAHAAKAPPPTATVAQVADHIDHVREVAGAEHVGLGGDFDGCDPMPAGLEDVSGYPTLIAELIDRGWSDNDIAALTRRNILRVLADAESVQRA
jgi:membrane dipeptidase